MAEPLKHLVGLDLVGQLAGNISNVMPAFNADGFKKLFAEQYLDLELMPRCHLVADCLYEVLPKDYLTALNIILGSLGPVHRSTTDFSDMSFLHLPFSLFVGKYGLEHFQESMAAQHQITQRFTAEFSIRAYIEHHPEQSFELFQRWIIDPNPHVRRLVSEGTRPRLPWASRLRKLQADPSPIIPILEALKDDPELYVRRSVANNLNDIGKDHPQLVYQLLAKWQNDSNKNRDWVISHALRSAIKRCEPEALALLGYMDAEGIGTSDGSITPDQTSIGRSVRISTTLSNQGIESKALMVDFAVHYIKANGGIRPKVFKWCQIELGASGEKTLSKKLNLTNLSTRTHYAGAHRVDIIINGQWSYLGTFDLA
jgi:3-methyladenine DNA glycosylase AlkC